MKPWHQRALEYFSAGKRPAQIANELEQSPRQVRRVLSKNGMDLSDGQRLPRSEYDFRFFKEIDSEAKAYFLGLLAADGYLLEGNENQGYRIKLCLIDCESLLDFAGAVGIKNPKIYRKGINGWEISISSQTMFFDLGALGVTPRKSLTLEFCRRVPDQFVRHYIRGYFDGDGCASWVRIRRYRYLHLNFAGTFEMLSAIENYLRAALQLAPKKIYSRPLQRIRVLQYTSQSDVSRVAMHLYGKSQYFMRRKYEIVTGVMNTPEKADQE